MIALGVTLLVVAALPIVAMLVVLAVAAWKFEDQLDSALTALFAPLHVIGVTKCDRCTVRARRAQAMLLLTAPFARWSSALRLRRAYWRQDASRHGFVEPFEGLMFTDTRAGTRVHRHESG